MLFEKIAQIWEKLTTDTSMLIATIVCVAAFAVLYYYLMKFLLDNQSGAMVGLFVMVMIVAAGILTFIENINTAIYLVIPAIFVIVTVILYTVEIKRVLWARRSQKLNDLKHGDGISYDEEQIQNCISEIIKALQNMSKNDVGAILVLSTGNVPNQILDSGVRIDSDISSELIESVFFPKTPLHDGAMIIQGDKIQAAGCFLPLSQERDLPKDLGTRHRAGIGITETINVTSIIVSEETGIVSYVQRGIITRYADSEALRQVLKDYYWQDLLGQK